LIFLLFQICSLHSVAENILVVKSIQNIDSAASEVFGDLGFILAFSAEICKFVRSAKSNKGRLV
jgi:hypothetical protein